VKAVIVERWPGGGRGLGRLGMSGGRSGGSRRSSSGGTTDARTIAASKGTSSEWFATELRLSSELEESTLRFFGASCVSGSYK